MIVVCTLDLFGINHHSFVEMKRYAHRAGATFFLLWGILHVVGGAALLATSMTDGAQGMLGMIDNGAAASGVGSIPTGIADGLARFHAFNLLWMGLLVSGIAIRMNWKNSWAGYWINLVVVVAADVGLLVYFVAPGYMPAADAIPGPLLAGLAVAFATIGLLTATAHTRNSPDELQPAATA